jgi:AbiJ N-terminal domain 4
MCVLDSSHKRPRSNPVCVKGLLLGAFCARSVDPVARGVRVVVASVLGSGVAVPKCRRSGICRPRWIQSRPWLPSRTRCSLAVEVGAKLAVDGVADPSFQAAHRFLARLPFGLLAEVVGAAGCVVTDLAERGDMDRMVQLAVPVRVQPMPLHTRPRPSVRPMARRFSERIGKRAVRVEIQRDDIDGALRNALWNVPFVHIKDVLDGYYGQDELQPVLERLWLHHFNEPLDELSATRMDGVLTRLKQGVLSGWAWFEVYDFMEAWPDAYPEHGPTLDSRTAALFRSQANACLERELSAYRFVGSELPPVLRTGGLSCDHAALAVS